MSTAQFKAAQIKNKRGKVVDYDREAFFPYIKMIAEDAAEQIARRGLIIEPIKIALRVDPSSGKLRYIGVECPMQQIFDYIVVKSSMDILMRFIVLEQVSSIKKRGQDMGVRLIRYWVKNHKPKYHVKGDITKCFPSAKYQRFLELFGKYCVNDDILWLWATLFETHKAAYMTIENYKGECGMIVGALPSCWAVQFMLSWVYRFAKGLHYERRGQRIKIFEDTLFFMDDILLTGNNRLKMQRSFSKVIKFARDFLGFSIKPNWHIKELEQEPIDMMGYVVHADGHITIRARVFLRARRNVLRYHANGGYKLKQAQRACSYKGYFKNSNSYQVRHKYDINKAMRAAAHVVSLHDRRDGA
ncbi:MAG: hypothetical protein ACI3WS_01345 [Phascolarctobacterium sp.]